jgi:hypothetical protein
VWIQPSGDAMFRDYLCVLLADCMSEPIGHGLPRTNHDASLLSAEMALGWISETDPESRPGDARVGPGRPNNRCSGRSAGRPRDLTGALGHEFITTTIVPRKHLNSFKCGLYALSSWSGRRGVLSKSGMGLNRNAS